MALEPVTGTRGVKFTDGTENSLVRDVASRIAFLQPDAAPLIALLNGIKAKKKATNKKFEWIESELPEDTVVVQNAAGTGTTIDVATGTGVRVRPNDLLITETGESISVTSISTDQLTVVRSMGAVAAQTLAVGDELVIIGGSVEEASGPAEARHTTKSFKHNFIQIFKDAVRIGDVQEASESYGGDDVAFQRMVMAIKHKRDIEKAFLFGDRFELTTGTQSRWGTGGLIFFITTNVTDAGETITEVEFEDFLRDVFRFQPAVVSQSKWALLSPIMVSAVNFWAKGHLQTASKETSFGVRLKEYYTGHGNLRLTRHWLLDEFADYSSFSFFLDPANIKYRFMEGKLASDTRLYVNTGNKEDSFMQDEYRSYVGLEVDQERTHGILKNVKGFAP